MKLSQLDRVFTISASQEEVKKKSLNLIDESAHSQKGSLKDFADDKKEKSKGQLMVGQAAIDSFGIKPGGSIYKPKRSL